MALLEANRLRKIYLRAGSEFRAVDDVSFSVERGETLGLVGESGSGKSTVARLLLRLLPASGGSAHFAGEPIFSASPRAMRRLRRRMQIVFQDPYAALNPRMRIADILAEPLRIHGAEDGSTRTRFDSALARTRVAEMLRAVGLDESALPRHPHEFSGGQRQRINIARALMLRPEFLVLDEPISALDVSVGAQVVNLLRHLQRDFSLTYLFISHSMPLVRYLSNRIAVMRRGRLVELGTCEEICLHPLDEYTRTLLAATPEMPVIQR